MNENQDDYYPQNEQDADREVFLNIISTFLGTNMFHDIVIESICSVIGEPEDDGESDYTLFERVKKLPLKDVWQITTRIVYRMKKQSNSQNLN